MVLEVTSQEFLEPKNPVNCVEPAPWVAHSHSASTTPEAFQPSLSFTCAHVRACAYTHAEAYTCLARSIVLRPTIRVIIIINNNDKKIFLLIH